MRASDSSVGAGQTSRFRHTQQFHKNEIGLDDIVFQSRNLDEHHLNEKYQSSGSCNRSCSFFDALHFLFLALMARLSSAGLISRPVTHEGAGAPSKKPQVPKITSSAQSKKTLCPTGFESQAAQVQTALPHMVRVWCATRRVCTEADVKQHEHS